MIQERLDVCLRYCDSVQFSHPNIGIFESGEKSTKSSGVSRDAENLFRGEESRRFKRAEISPNAMWEERFHQFSPPRMEEIRNDYTRERGGRRYSAWSRNMNLDKWRAAFHWNGRKGNRILQEKRKIRGGEKDRWRLRRRLWKSWFQSRSLSIRFRFVSIAKF